jgi:hypothetical protein
MNNIWQNKEVINICKRLPPSVFTVKYHIMVYYCIFAPIRTFGFIYNNSLDFNKLLKQTEVTGTKSLNDIDNEFNKYNRADFHKNFNN